MRKAKWLIIGFLLMICFLFAITLFLPSKVTVSKSIIINASIRDVKNQIQYFNNWKNWHPAFLDKEISIAITGDSSATLHDKQEREIMFRKTQQEAGTLYFEVEAIGKEMINYQFIISPDKERNTQVIWNANTNLGWYPWKKIQGVVMDKLTGPEYVLALQNLKMFCEAGSMKTKPE